MKFISCLDVKKVKLELLIYLSPTVKPLLGHGVPFTIEDAAAPCKEGRHSAQ
jgi:hypothetical protein